MSTADSAGAAAPDYSRLQQDPHYGPMANAIRVLAMDAVERAKSGHPGMPMGMADVATVLFAEHLKFDPADPHWPDRDRFILSAGHGSMLQYALFYLTGYPEMTIGQIEHLRQIGSLTPGHPEYRHTPGIETTTGPLGQGLATSVGMALAERHMNARFGDELVDHFTYVIAGDGCLMEGISHEALGLAGYLGLGRLIVFWDDNSVTIDGRTDLAVSGDIPGYAASHGWHVQKIDGHDVKAVSAAIAAAKAETGRPSFIACKTIIGLGAPTRAGTSKAHSDAFGAEEIAGARKRLGWPYPPFEVPDDILGQWRELGRRGAATRAAWQARLDAQEANKRRSFSSGVAGGLTPGWEAALAEAQRKFLSDRPSLATRAASGQVLEFLAPAMPELIGGSADLTGSNNTKAKSQKVIGPHDYAGTYLHYGVREHGMAAAMSGLALHGGVVPYGGTFLVFADYARPAMRLAALMGIRVIYVMTHDSIGLGGDGPTHQPVETIAGLRALPNMLVLRPADPIETAECWAIALRHETTPSVLALSRQAVPTLRNAAGENLSERGAYVLEEASAPRRATILATGSEVSLAVEARRMLEAKGIPTAVVSMPCWALFERQDEAYRTRVLGTIGTRVAVEAAVRQGWDRWIGSEGRFVGMHSFGVSGPPEETYGHFGITAEAVVAAVKAGL